MDDREKLISLMEEIRGKFNLDLNIEEVKERIAIIDEELDNCINKIRSAVYGLEIKMAIIEYEGLMLERSNLMVYELFMKEKEAMQRCVKRMQWCSRTRRRGR